MSTNPQQKNAQLNDRTTQLETKTQPASQPKSLEERVEKIEATLLLIADVY